MNKQALLKRLEIFEDRLMTRNEESVEEIIGQWLDFLQALLLDEAILKQVLALPFELGYQTFRDSREYRQKIKTILKRGDDDDG